MAWNTVMTIIVRNLINDVSEATYDDSRIETCIVIAGIMVSQQYDFVNTYTFDVETPSITPDPTAAATYELAAISLISLKAACILETNRWQAGSSGGGGVRVKIGEDEIDTKGSWSGYKDVLQLGPCGAYEKLLNTLSQNKSMLLGKAVATPISSLDFIGNPSSVADLFNGLAER